MTPLAASPRRHEGLFSPVLLQRMQRLVNNSHFNTGTI